MQLWESLTPEQRKAVELRDEEKGYKSGLAEPCTMADYCRSQSRNEW